MKKNQKTENNLKNQNFELYKYRKLYRKLEKENIIKLEIQKKRTRQILKQKMIKKNLIKLEIDNLKTRKTKKLN